MILRCGNTRVSEDLHFPQVEATVHVHLVTLVSGKTGQYYCYWLMRMGLVRRSQKEVRLPRAHFSVDEGEKKRRKSRGEEIPLHSWISMNPEQICGVWRLCVFICLPVLFNKPVYWYLPRKSSFFLKQMGAHPRKLLGAATCRKNVQISPLRPSTELLRPRWPPRHERANAHKTEKK